MTVTEERLDQIEQRNARVEGDKAWETSWCRRGMIMLVTYVCAYALMSILNNEGAAKSALIPVLGYVLSTLSLPAAKKIWLERKTNQRI